VESLNPNYADTWNNLGILLKGIRKKKEAIKCFKKALEKNPVLRGKIKPWSFLL